MKDSIIILKCKHLNVDKTAVKYCVFFECEKEKGVVIFENVEKYVDYILAFVNGKKVSFKSKERKEIIKYCFTYLTTQSIYKEKAINGNWRLKGDDKN